MAGKLFIVAKGDVATYESLRRSVGGEPDVAIIYDRRAEPVARRAPGKLIRHLRGPADAGAPAPAGSVRERRLNTVAEEIKRRGWAVVRRGSGDHEPDRGRPTPPPPTPPPVRRRGHAPEVPVTPPSAPDGPRAAP